MRGKVELFILIVSLLDSIGAPVMKVRVSIISMKQ